MVNISDIWQFELTRDSSPNPREGACLLDAVSWFEYGTLGDQPPCVCPVIATFGRCINDALPDNARQRLIPYIPRLIGTVDPKAEVARAEYLAWQAVRVFAPLVLAAWGFKSEAQKLRMFQGSLQQAATAAYTVANATTAYTDTRIAATAAYAAARLAATAAHTGTTAGAAAYAAAYAVDLFGIENEVIATLDGVLRIGKQAEPIAPDRVMLANRTFALASTR